jgi:hypothetical protein
MSNRRPELTLCRSTVWSVCVTGDAKAAVAPSRHPQSNSDSDSIEGIEPSGRFFGGISWGEFPIIVTEFLFHDDFDLCLIHDAHQVFNLFWIHGGTHESAHTQHSEQQNFAKLVFPGHATLHRPRPLSETSAPRYARTKGPLRNGRSTGLRRGASELAEVEERTRERQGAEFQA